MLDRVHEYERGRLGLAKLVDDLRGLYVEADPQDSGVRDDFESKWIRLDHQNELRTATWTSEVSDDVQLAQRLEAFHHWVKGVLADDQTTDHR
jgi:hypothetical protein